MEIISSSVKTEVRVRQSKVKRGMPTSFKKMVKTEDGTATICIFVRMNNQTAELLNLSNLRVKSNKQNIR